MKRIIKFLLIIAAVFSSNNISKASASVLENYYTKIRDIDVVFSGNGSMIITEDNRLLVTGKEFFGEFGDGEIDSLYLGFHEIDISFIDSKVTDIITAQMRIFLLTESGEVFYTGGIYDEDKYLTTFIKVDQSSFNDKPVSKVFRTISYTTFLNSEGELFITGQDQFANFLIKQMPLNVATNKTLKVKHVTMQSMYLYILDEDGSVWLTDSFYQLFMDDGYQIPVYWKPVCAKNGESVNIVAMINIATIFFLTDDHRIFFSGGYNNVYLEAHFMEYANIDNVASFLPYYSMMYHSHHPNFIAVDGTYHVGKNVVDHYYGITPIEQDYLIDLNDYIPEAVGASVISIGMPPMGSPGNNYSSGLFIKDGNLYSINGGESAFNGIYSLEDYENPSISKITFDKKIIKMPALPIVEKTENPQSIQLPGIGQEEIPIQSNWKIVNQDQAIVASGAFLEVSMDNVVDISLLDLAPGDYQFIYFQETQSSYEGEYAKSEQVTIGFLIKTVIEGNPQDNRLWYILSIVAVFGIALAVAFYFIRKRKNAVR